MRHHLEAVLLRRQLGFGHEIKLLSQFLRGIGDVAEPPHQVRRSIEAAKVQVTWPVAEPAPHLHERVIHLRGAHEIAHAKALQRQAPRELVATDRNHLECRAGRGIVQRVLCSAVDGADLDVVQYIGQHGKDVIPARHRGRKLLDGRQRRNLVAYRKEVLLPEFAQLAQQFLRIIAAVDLLAHAAHCPLDLLAHMLLHVHVARDVDQHGTMLFALAAQFAGRAGEDEGIDGLSQRWRNDLLAVVGWCVRLLVLGWHPSRVRLGIVVIEDVPREGQRIAAPLLGHLAKHAS